MALNGLSNRERSSWNSVLQQSAPRSCIANVRATVQSRYRNATGDRNQISQAEL